MSQRAPFIILDDARPDHEQLTIFEGAVGTITAHQPGELPAAFASITRALDQGLHVAGYFSYELGYALEKRLVPLMPHAGRVPLLWFGLFRERQQIYGADAEASLAARTSGRAYAGPLHFDETLESYKRSFDAVKEYIAAGDIYQANLTFRARFTFVGDPMALYLRLRPRAGAAHCAYVDDGAHAFLSLSPELFFDVQQGAIAARPMKGTAARGHDAATDMQARARLQASEKNRAENLMIVDLIRNDLGRVARIGTVRVEDLFAIETFPTVHQMVSTVRAQLRPGTTPEVLIGALFPCGSVTGAPKIRAMEIIRELERGPRGLYCGAVGAFSPDGSARFNVAIRTLAIADGEGELGIGGALVADSTLVSEYEECLLKARYFSDSREPIALIETLRHSPKEGFMRGPLHLARMARSALAFGMAFDKAAAQCALDDAVRGHDGPSRLRLVLAENGAFTCERKPLSENAQDQVWTYAISERRVHSDDALLRHKTSWREFYESEFALLNQRFGCDEVIFLNQRGEITEGSHSNVFARLGDRLITPPLSSGLLDGCLRRALLDDQSAHCEEGVLTLADLELADAVFLGNSLRGLMRAVQVGAKLRATG